MGKRLIIILIPLIILLISACDVTESTSPEEEYTTYFIAVSNVSIEATTIYNISIESSESDSVIVIDSLQSPERTDFYTFQFPSSTPEQHQVILTYNYNNTTISHTIVPPYERTVIHIRGNSHTETTEDDLIPCDITWINKSDTYVYSIFLGGIDPLWVPDTCFIDSLAPLEISEIVLNKKFYTGGPIHSVIHFVSGNYIMESQSYNIVSFPLSQELTIHINNYGYILTYNYYEYDQYFVNIINDSSYEITNIYCSMSGAAMNSISLPDLASNESTGVFEFYFPVENSNYTEQIFCCYSMNNSFCFCYFMPTGFNVNIHLTDDGYWVE